MKILAIFIVTIGRWGCGEPKSDVVTPVQVVITDAEKLDIARNAQILDGYDNLKYIN